MKTYVFFTRGQGHTHHDIGPCHRIARSPWSSAWWPFTAARPSWVGHASGMVATGASSFFRRWIHGWTGCHWLKWGVWMLKLDEKVWKIFGDFKDWFDGFFQEFIVSFRGVFSDKCLKGIRWDQPHPQPLWRLEDRLIFSDNQTKKGIFVHCGNEMGQLPGVVFFKDQTPGGCERDEMLEDMGCNLSEHTWGGWGLRWVMFFWMLEMCCFFTVLGLEGCWEYKEGS